MTVAELVEALKEMPQDAPVVVRGYEDGLDDVVSVKEYKIVLDYYTGWYFGRHELLRLSDEKAVLTEKKASECETCTAVYLGSNARAPGVDD